MNKKFVEFTSDMKDTHTILIPNMLPIHFKLVKRILENYGYKAELLETEGAHIAETGLKYVHNDTCYPAILVIGQMMDALLSGKYDLNKTALMLFQTGGGCRASNYVSLMRKALVNAGMEQIPVIPLSFAGIEKHSGFDFSVGMIVRMACGILYGDFMMSLANQVRTYEINKGDVAALCDKWTEKLVGEMADSGISFGRMKKNYAAIIRDFAAIPRENKKAVKVGVVGEIYVKFSPLGNNNLEKFLVSEGAEVVLPGLVDFFNYCFYNGIMDYKLYGHNFKGYLFNKAAFEFLCALQADQIKAIKKEGTFRPMTPFKHTLELTKGYIGHGTKMGEGWLLSAEMLELADSGVMNIVCTQPFGCLPNHICGKGMMKPIKESIPEANIVAIDYDAGASAVNQENRLKLMLSSARAALEEKEDA
ncbi:MAG: 2-hydroxyglutaryl-CoA dehydratase [Ruminococcaceae bacterium]|nr:2-hydroxyglutaryl-CoA dehydratase [Oscillospiraceae bacterium]